MDSWKQWLPDCRIEWQLRPPEAGVEAVRRQLLAALDDCHGTECDRLRWRLHTAERAQELWLLRDQIFQVVTTQHCLAQAQERIEGFVTVFRGVLPAGMVRRA
jgi:hypothetical protein